MIVNEGLRIKDLQYLVSNYVSIDQYTSKLDDDNITIAFFCNEKEVAEDLRDFIEKIYYIEIRDIEISDSLTDDNKFILFGASAPSIVASGNNGINPFGLTSSG